MKNKQRTVLLLAYDFPPFTSVGGLRPHSWYKSLKNYDINPVLITRQWSNHYGNELDYIAASETNKTIFEETQYGTVIRTPYKPNLSNRLLLKYGHNKNKLSRKFITAFFEFTQFFFLIGPKSKLYFEAKKYLQNNRVDYIIATGEPFVLFKYASKLSNQFKTPWIADYRDPWTQSELRSPNKIMKFWNGTIEKHLLKNCSRIVTVSECVKSLISQINKTQPYAIIPNGFDEFDKEKLVRISQNQETLTITLAGSIYDWHPIESVLDTLIDKKIKLNLYGISSRERLERLFQGKYKLLKDNIQIYSKLSNDALLEKLLESNLLLLFNDYSILGSKIYNYLIANRKILFCFQSDKDALLLKNHHFPFKNNKNQENNLQEQVIQKTKSGVIVRDKQHLMEVLEELQDEFNKHKYIHCDTCNIEEYSRESSVKLLAKIINQNAC